MDILITLNIVVLFCSVLNAMDTRRKSELDVQIDNLNAYSENINKQLIEYKEKYYEQKKLVEQLQNEIDCLEE